VAKAEVTIWAALNDKPATEGLRRLTRGFADLQAAGSMIGAPIVGALGAITASLVGTTKVAVDFQKAVAEVGTVSDRAQWSLANIAKVSDEMARSFGTTGAQSARALYEVISAGITDSARATETLTAAQKLSVGGLTDVKVAVDGLTTILNAYQSTGVTATQVTDAMFIAVRDGKTRAEELAQSIGLVAPIASATGVSVDQLLASIAQLTTQGIRTSTAAEGLRSALGNVVKPTKEAADVAAELGINFSVAAIQSRGLSGFLNDVVTNSGATREQLGKLFGDIQGLTAVLALTNDGGAKFNEILDHMSEKAGATDVAFKAMTETVDFQLSRFDALRESIMRAFGDGLVNASAFKQGLVGINAALETTGSRLGRLAGETTGTIGGMVGIGLAGAGKFVANLVGSQSVASAFDAYGRAQAQGLRRALAPTAGDVGIPLLEYGGEPALPNPAGDYTFSGIGRDGPSRPPSPRAQRGARTAAPRAALEAGSGAVSTAFGLVDTFVEATQSAMAQSIPQLQLIFTQAERLIFGTTDADNAREQSARADAANFWIVSQADMAEAAIAQVRDRLGSATQTLVGMLAGNRDSITAVLGDMSMKATDAATNMFVGIGDAIGTGTLKLDSMLGQFAGAIVRMIGVQLIQMGTAALALSALSFIPFFQGVTGPPGFAAGAGAVALAAGIGLVAAGSALGAAASGGAGTATSTARTSGNPGAARAPSSSFTGGVGAIDTAGMRGAGGPVTINVSMGVVGDRRAAALLVADLYDEASARQLGARRGFA
jgi:TP901 family phage tail tape measure protein